MVFDLGIAMRRKEEFESARLADFDFRCRVRATRLLVAELGLDPVLAAELVAAGDEDAAIARLATLTDRTLAVIEDAYRRCRTQARAALIAEIGDPAPFRMG